MERPSANDPLDYATPPPGRRHSVLGIVAFAVAVMAGAVPTVMCVMIWHAKRSGMGIFDVSVSAGYFALPATAITLAAVAIRRRSRLMFPAVAVALSVGAVAAVLLIHGRMF